MAPSPSVRRFAFRLRFAVAIRRFVRGIDISDGLTVLSLGLILAGFTVPLVGAVVVGVLLIPVTPIGPALRILVRGR